MLYIFGKILHYSHIKVIKPKEWYGMMKYHSVPNIPCQNWKRKRGTVE